MPAMTRRRAKFKAETGIDVRKWDVGNYDACAANLKKIESDIGPVDMLVNNAGITKRRHVPQDDGRAVVRGDQHQSQFAVQHDAARDRRACASAASAASSASPRSTARRARWARSNYSAAKAGDIGFVKALAQEGAAKGITVNCICPGYIATEMVMAVPKEVLDKRSSR